MRNKPLGGKQEHQHAFSVTLSTQLVYKANNWKNSAVRLHEDRNLGAASWDLPVLRFLKTLEASKISENTGITFSKSISQYLIIRQLLRPSLGCNAGSIRTQLDGRNTQKEVVWETRAVNSNVSG